MANPTNPKLVVEAQALVKKWGSYAEASRKSGIPQTTLRDRTRYLSPLPVSDDSVSASDVLAFIKRHSGTVHSIAHALKAKEKFVSDSIDFLISKGHNIFNYNGTYSVTAEPVPVETSEELHTYASDSKGHYRFGFVTDNHLCSKYAREDVLADLYDWFADEGITRVYNAGNWIDGEARFNVYDLKVRGMEAQCEYFAQNYPQRDGIHTYYVAGDDHEGWYSQREGVDIGKYAERVARDAGRTDLHYLGYMESFITLRHSKSKAENKMLVVHPGGGSSYAISYAPQKIVESLQGGEKPAIILLGHYHKMDFFNYRNVWIVQGGTTEDQTPFMRKKRLEAHVGGSIIELRQGERGEINDVIPWMRRYFDRGYYNNRFSLSGPVFNPTMKGKK